jgi:hypothetical protein
MPGDASSYAALGLDPDADPAAIERAYKRLIKLHHPDREGGDASRAAEINRAYRELRTRLAPSAALVLADDDPLPRDTAGSGWVRAAAALAIALAVLVVVTGPVAAYIRDLVPASAPQLPGGQARARAADPMDQPLHVAAVSGAIQDALLAANAHDDSALLSASRECHRTLRLDPSVSQLDRCAAFDDAVVELQDRDPMWDQGPFSQIAVTGRQWSAAAALSNDYLAIDSRLDRIRLQVELALAPPDLPRLPAPVSLPPIENSPAAPQSQNAEEQIPEN